MARWQDVPSIKTISSTGTPDFDVRELFNSPPLTNLDTKHPPAVKDDGSFDFSGTAGIYASVHETEPTKHR